VETRQIRPATSADVPRIWELVLEFSEHVNLSHVVSGTSSMLSESLFGPTPFAEALVAEEGGNIVGYAVYYTTFSTFAAKPCIWLEDVYVTPEIRGRGIGKAFLAKIAEIARERGCPRFEWDALDWNEPSIRFYESLGAWRMMDSHTFRLEGDALAALCGSKPEALTPNS
jgi:GNAT superfamily N-acetyltransferase